MLRIISYRKAIIAGIAGALAWEIAARVLLFAGVPVFDMVRLLGTLVASPAEPLGWWPAGLALHCVAGAVWAIFYGLFDLVLHLPFPPGLLFAWFA